MSDSNEITSLYEELIIPALDDEVFAPWLCKTQNALNLPPTTLDLSGVTFDLAAWIETATPHSLTPHMKPDQFEALKLSIQRFGIIDGVIYLDERGHVVDGYHRMRAIYELLTEGHEISPPDVRFVQFDSKQDEMAFVILLNITRRMLDDDEKEQVLIKILRSGHDGTDNWLSSLTGIGADKVRDVRAFLENIPVSEGGIEYLLERRSEAGKAYQQKRLEPTSKKRRELAGLEPEVVTKAETHEAGVDKRHQPSTDEGSLSGDKEVVHDVVDDDVIRHDDSSHDVDVIRSLDISKKARCDQTDDDEVSSQLKLLIRSWWAEYQFLPVTSREIATLMAEKTGQEVNKVDADRMTRRLKSVVGKKVEGHLVLVRKMSANVAVFLLAPAVDGTPGIDWDRLITQAGTAT